MVEDDDLFGEFDPSALDDDAPSGGEVEEEVEEEVEVSAKAEPPKHASAKSGARTAVKKSAPSSINDSEEKEQSDDAGSASQSASEEETEETTAQVPLGDKGKGKTQGGGDDDEADKDKKLRRTPDPPLKPERVCHLKNPTECDIRVAMARSDAVGMEVDEEGVEEIPFVVLCDLARAAKFPVVKVTGALNSAVQYGKDEDPLKLSDYKCVFSVPGMPRAMALPAPFCRTMLEIWTAKHQATENVSELSDALEKMEYVDPPQREQSKGKGKTAARKTSETPQANGTTGDKEKEKEKEKEIEKKESKSKDKRKHKHKHRSKDEAEERTDVASQADAPPTTTSGREKRKWEDASGAKAGDGPGKRARLPDPELLRLFGVLWEQLPDSEKDVHREAMQKTLRQSLTD